MITRQRPTKASGEEPVSDGDDPLVAAFALGDEQLPVSGPHIGSRAIPDPRSRTQALAWTALTASSIDPSQARVLLAEAESTAADIAHPLLRASPLAAVIQAAAKIDPLQCGTVARRN